MQNEPLTGARVPQQSDGPLGGLQITNAIDDVAPLMLHHFADASARDTAWSNWSTANSGAAIPDGAHCYLTNPGDFYDRYGGAWHRRGRATQQVVTGWTNATYAATNNYNLGNLVINPGYPFIALVHAAGVFSPGSGSNGALRINQAGPGIIAVSSLSATQVSAQPVASLVSTDGSSQQVYANLQVLAGSITTYADPTHSRLEAVVWPL